MATEPHLFTDEQVELTEVLHAQPEPRQPSISLAVQIYRRAVHHPVRLIIENLEARLQGKDEGLLVIVRLRVILPARTGKRAENVVAVHLLCPLTRALSVSDKDQGLPLIT